MKYDGCVYAYALAMYGNNPVNKNVDTILSFQKPNATFSDNSKSNQLQTSNSNSNSTVDNSIKNNVSALSSSSISNKSTSVHETPKDHSINIDSAAPYYQGKPILF